MAPPAKDRPMTSFGQAPPHLAAELLELETHEKSPPAPVVELAPDGNRQNGPSAKGLAP